MSSKRVVGDPATRNHDTPRRGRRSPQPFIPPFIRNRLVVAVLMGIVTAGGVHFVLPGMPSLWALVIGMSLTAFTLYGLDKAAARRHGVRIPEAVLHLVALLGGSPGALLGQWGFRHKTRKVQFQAITSLIVAVQAAALWLWRR